MSAHEIREAIASHIATNPNQVTTSCGTYLQRKGQTLQEYEQFIAEPGNPADEMALFLLASIKRLHVAVILQNTVWCTEENGPTKDCPIWLGYLGRTVYVDSRDIKQKPMGRGRRPKSECHYRDTSSEESSPQRKTYRGTGKAQRKNPKRRARPTVIKEASTSEEEEGQLFSFPKEVCPQDKRVYLDRAAKHENRKQPGKHFTHLKPPPLKTDTSSDDSDLTDIEPPQDDLKPAHRDVKQQKPGNRRPSRKAKTLAAFHLKTYTYAQPRYNCNMCHRRFRAYQQLKDHKDLVHLHRTHECTVANCTKTYRSKAACAAHVLTHSVGRFACRQCQRTFHYRSNLKNHRQAHSNVRPFGCNICQQKFKLPYQLKQHMDSHAQDKLPCPFKDCQYVGKSRRNVDSHFIGMHTERCYTCEKCGFTAKHRSGMKRHRDKKIC
jgi:hypothetical protein